MHRLCCEAARPSLKGGGRGGGGQARFFITLERERNVSGTEKGVAPPVFLEVVWRAVNTGRVCLRL